MTKRNGFTVTELFIAVIILGLLVAGAVPILSKNIEKSKTGEAAANLNLIRMSERDYFLDNNSYTASFSDLSIDDPNNIASTNRYFNYTIESADASGFTARATRKDGPYTGDYYTIDQTGTITSNGHFQL